MKLHSIEQPWVHMFSGYRRIFWGILLMLFHINLGSIQILPNFIGYILIASGVGCLKKVSDSSGLRRASVFAGILVFASFLEFAGGLFIISPPLTVLITGITAGCMLILIYDILNASSEILRLCNQSAFADDTDNRLHIFLVLGTLEAITLVLLAVFSEQTAIFTMAIFGIVFRLWLVGIFAGLKRQCDGSLFKNADFPE